MLYDWGPHYIIPSEVIKTYSGIVVLREDLNDELLSKELHSFGIDGPILKITNPWYFRKKGTGTWIKIGESEDRKSNFAIKWDTSSLDNGKYQVMGLMHVFAKKQNREIAIARQNIVEVTV